MQFYVVRHPGVGMYETRVSDNLVLLTKIKVKPYFLICIRTNQIYVSAKWDFQLVLLVFQLPYNVLHFGLLVLE